MAPPPLTNDLPTCPPSSRASRPTHAAQKAPQRHHRGCSPHPRPKMDPKTHRSRPRTRPPAVRKYNFIGSSASSLEEHGNRQPCGPPQPPSSLCTGRAWEQAPHRTASCCIVGSTRAPSRTRTHAQTPASHAARAGADGRANRAHMAASPPFVGGEAFTARTTCARRQPRPPQCRRPQCRPSSCTSCRASSAPLGPW